MVFELYINPMYDKLQNESDDNSPDSGKKDLLKNNSGANHAVLIEVDHPSNVCEVSPKQDVVVSNRTPEQVQDVNNINIVDSVIMQDDEPSLMMAQQENHGTSLNQSLNPIGEGYYHLFSIVSTFVSNHIQLRSSLRIIEYSFSFIAGFLRPEQLQLRQTNEQSDQELSILQTKDNRTEKEESSYSNDNTEKNIDTNML